MLRMESDEGSMEAAVGTSHLDGEVLAEKRLRTGDNRAFAAVIEALRRASRGKEDARIDVIQRLDLGPLKRHFGDWDRVSAKARTMVDFVLEQTTRAGDRFIWSEEDEILLLRANGSQGFFDYDAQRLIRALTARLCGTARADRAPTIQNIALDFEAELKDVSSLGDLLDRIAIHEAWGPDTELRDRLGNKGQLRLRFRPTINFRKGLIGAYQAVPHLDYVDGRLEAAGSTIAQGETADFAANLDRWILKEIDALVAGAPTFVRAGIILPLQSRTMMYRRYRDPYLEICRTLSPLTRKRLVLQLLNLPFGMPQSRIRDLTTYLVPHCVTIIADQSHGFTVIDNLANTGVRIISLDAGGTGDFKASLLQLQGLVMRAEAGRLRSFVFNSDAIHLSHAAVRLGSTYFNGKALMPTVAKPGRIIRIKPRHYLGRELPKAARPKSPTD